MTQPKPEDIARQIADECDRIDADPDALEPAIAAAIREAEARGERLGIERARQRIDSVRFERYAVAEPGAQYKWQAALELADDVRALLVAAKEPKRDEPCATCKGTGKVRSLVEYPTPHHEMARCLDCGGGA